MDLSMPPRVPAQGGFLLMPRAAILLPEAPSPLPPA